MDLAIEHMSTGNQIFQTEYIVNILGETYQIFSSAYNIINECIFNLKKKIYTENIHKED